MQLCWQDHPACAAAAAAQNKSARQLPPPSLAHHPNGNHIGLRPVARSNPGVESLRHEVDRRLAHGEFQMDFRVRRQEASPGRAMTAAAATCTAYIRSRPIGCWRFWFKSSSARAIWLIAGRSCSSNRKPASVTDTLRVVRFSNRTPRRSSNCRIE